MPNGTIRFAGGEHVVWNGTANGDRVWSSEGDDTVRGNDADDWMQGGDGNDNLIGGLGDDTMQDLNGDDVLKGGDGDDAISSGQGFGGDLNQGGRGKDFIVGGNDITETFGGPGDDFVFAGDAEDTVFGDDGDDWIEAGKGPFNLLQGDNGAPFQDDPNEPGHDVLDGDGGEQDYDSEGGDDIMLAGPGIQRSEGMLGFDWVTHKNDPLAANSDMDFTGLLPPGVETNRDRFDLVEALSGWSKNDVLRGDDRVDTDLGVEHELNQAGIDRISGLAGLLPDGTTSFNAGNIIIGGAGNDLIEGRGGNDIIDGDAWLNTRLSVRNPANPASEIGSAEGMNKPYLVGNTRTLQTAVFNGLVDPENIVITREILSDANGIDTALFSGPRGQLHHHHEWRAHHGDRQRRHRRRGHDPQRRAAAVPEWRRYVPDGRDRGAERADQRHGDAGQPECEGHLDRSDRERRSDRELRLHREVWCHRHQHDEHRADDHPHRDRAEPRAEVHVRGACGQPVRCRTVRGLERDHGGGHAQRTDRAAGHPRQHLGVAVVDSGR